MVILNAKKIVRIVKDVPKTVDHSESLFFDQQHI